MIRTHRLAAGACALLAALATGILVPAVPADAAADDTTAAAPQVDLVLDVSGSMRATDIDGESRMAAAKQAFNEVLDATPAEVQLGIRTLGANYPGNDRQTGCKDTAQLYPVGTLNRTEAKAAVATLTPTGWTPIGPALLKAADDFQSGEGSKRIVLITDGSDTCAPLDPCEVAREIAAKGIDMTVDTLGLVPTTAMSKQLSCIAEATGGTYTSVEHRSQLTDKVNQLVDRAADPVVNPTAVAGTSACTSAPTLKSGLYSDREEFAQHRFYRVELKPGQELRTSVSVGVDRTVDPDYGVLLRAITLHGREIVRGEATGTGRTDALSTGLRYAKPESDDDDDADTAETVCLELSNSFTPATGVKTTPGLPLELTVDVVAGPDGSSDVASFGLGRGWWLLGALILTGFLAGVLWGWVSRWRIAVWRTN
ncbi:von Willebrand factor type A [Actinobacteria bacterium OK074]|nr:von Willebrand factor type A [Actinobacteria bacterium OK074]